jgi:murein DD-endopeptidase MepM/ murein hydrolase activator NlpD
VIKKRGMAERFSVLIVPKNRSRIRRMEFSRYVVCAALVGFIAFVGVCVYGVYSLVHYRGEYYATEAVRIQAAEFARERASLMGRLAELEDSIARADRFAAKIENGFKREDGEVVGKGPVDEERWLPDPNSATVAVKRRLGEGVWKSPFSKSFTAGMNLKLEALSSRIDSVEGRIHSLFELKQDKFFFWASLPSIWPTRGWITSGYGAVRSWGGRRRRHEGIDIAGPRGTPIIAPGDGVITFKGYKGGYGRTLIIDHGYGISTLYGHCSKLYVGEGQRVKRGMIIATVGNTGRSTGPHLHYEVRIDGVAADPMPYIIEKM